MHHVHRQCCHRGICLTYMTHPLLYSALIDVEMVVVISAVYLLNLNNAGVRLRLYYVQITPGNRRNVLIEREHLRISSKTFVPPIPINCQRS